MRSTDMGDDMANLTPTGYCQQGFPSDLVVSGIQSGINLSHKAHFGTVQPTEDKSSQARGRTDGPGEFTTQPFPQIRKGTAPPCYGPGSPQGAQPRNPFLFQARCFRNAIGLDPQHVPVSVLPCLTNPKRIPYFGVGGVHMTNHHMVWLRHT
jgi:hypothetical protein